MKTSSNESIHHLVLYIVTSKSEGGIERYSVRLAEQLTKRDVPLWFACRPHGFVEEECHSAGVKTLPLHVRNSGDISAVFKLAQLIRKHEIEIVHVHSRRDYFPAMLAVSLARSIWRKTPVRLILHVHLIRALGDPAALNGKIFMRGTDAILAVSEATREFLIKSHGFPKGFVILLHNGIDLNAFALPGSPQALIRRKELRDQWSIPQDALVVGMIGRLDAKGQEHLLNAAPALIARFPNLHIVLVGSEGEAKTQERLLQIVEKNDILGHVVFAGKQNDIPKVVAAFDMLAHLPTDESFGLALAEAMAAGLPTVATNIGGCTEVVRDNETGLLVTPGDEEGLIAALSRLLEPGYGPMLRSRFGIAGRRLVERSFSLNTQIDRLQELYDMILTRTKKTK
jgi:glycosyltransferase involved in cell wall biosynthesis